MHGHSNKLIVVYVLVGIITISSLVYSLNFSLSDISSSNRPTSETDSNIYEIALGNSKTIKGIVYTFSEVISDNRCAEDKVCSNPGNAEIEIQIGAFGSSEDLRISTNSPTTYANVSISIEELNPKPVLNTKEAVVKLKIIETN